MPSNAQPGQLCSADTAADHVAVALSTETIVPYTEPEEIANVGSGQNLVSVSLIQRQSSDILPHTISAINLLQSHSYPELVFMVNWQQHGATKNRNQQCNTWLSPSGDVS